MNQLYNFKIKTSLLLNSIHFTFLLLLVLLISVNSFAFLDAKYVIDYSESGEFLIFDNIDDNTIGIRINHEMGDQNHLIYISRNANNSALVFQVTNPSADMQPSYSYDKSNWYPIKNYGYKGSSFTFSAQFSESSVWIALKPLMRTPKEALTFNPPYYTLNDITEFVEKNKNHPLVDFALLGKSVRDRDIVQFTITNKDKPDSLKKYVWLQFRIHGNENEQSYICEGLVDYLLENSEGDGINPLLDKFVFKVIPVINPDGVVNRQRANQNGVDLNRNWTCAQSPKREEKEVVCVHKTIDDLIENQRKKISFGIDFHGWGGGNDGGFRCASSFAGRGFYNDQTTFLKILVKHDKWQRVSSWNANAPTAGMSRYALYNQHKLNYITSETTSGKRYDGSATTRENLREQGKGFALGLYNYLFHIHFVDQNGQPVQTYKLNDRIYVKLEDDDANSNSSSAEKYDVTVVSESGDSEKITVTETGNNTAIFTFSTGLGLAASTPVNNDGILQVSQNDELIKVTYVDSDFPSDETFNIAYVEESTGNGNFNLSNLSANRMWLSSGNSDNIRFHFYHSSEASEETVQLTIYNAAGQHIQTLHNKALKPGMHMISWDKKTKRGQNIGSGLYIGVLSIGSRVQTLALVL